MEQFALQEIYPEIRKIGAQLACITPDKQPLPAAHPLAQVAMQMGSDLRARGAPSPSSGMRAIVSPRHSASNTISLTQQRTYTGP
jgi:hypothetical protein